MPSGRRRSSLPTWRRSSPGRIPVRFTPQARYLQLLNLGDGTALFIRGTTVFRGKSAFFLKDYLDTSFVRTYQAG